jgi:hypothetical protein
MMVKKNPSKYHTHGRRRHSLAKQRTGGAEEGSGYRKPNKFLIQNGLAFRKHYKFTRSILGLCKYESRTHSSSQFSPLQPSSFASGAG